MARKQAKAAKKQKNNTAMKDINALHSCISKDQNQLEKLYRKNFVSATKNVLAVKKSLVKAKKLSVKAKRKNKVEPKAYQAALSAIQSIQKQLVALLDDHACIEAGYTKFNAQQKALLKLEKEWNKKTVNVRKKPTKRRKVVTETSVQEFSQIG